MPLQLSQLLVPPAAYIDAVAVVAVDSVVAAGVAPAAAAAAATAASFDLLL